MIASATKYMASSGPSCLSPFTDSSTKREFSLVYPFLGSIRSVLGENIRCELFMLSTNGKPLTSQNPVHLASAHSKSRSHGRFFSRARTRAATTSFLHGYRQYFSLARSAIARYWSGWASRQCMASIAPLIGSARYFANFLALWASLSFLANQICRSLCHFMACFWQQNLVRFPSKGTSQVRHLKAVFSNIFFLYPQNSSLARSI
jgi:hypothetical protein